MQNILLTTAISYTNGSPHIGHLYESVLADFINRVYKITGHNSKLLTGTDEHGKKIQETAKSLNILPIELCNKYSEEFKQMNYKMRVEYDYFIRTTQSEHIKLVQESVIKSQANFDIIKSEYSGFYNIREECFVSNHVAKQTNYLDPVTGKPYEIVNEPTYYFTTSNYLKEINQIIEKVFPEQYLIEIKTKLNSLKSLEFLSITRTTFDWGIKFPSDYSHVIYVWFDALLNYVTGKNILFGNEQVIPIHIIGKDILWFHSVIYPAILSSCGYRDLLPNKIITHGFILDSQGQKMSKSVGNAIDVQELMEKYPIDAIRYYLLTEASIGSDIKFSFDNLISKYNNVLIKNFGNLVQRIFNLIKPLESEINFTLNSENNQEIIIKNNNYYLDILKKFVQDHDISLYIDSVNLLISKLNKDLTDLQPWKLGLEEKVNILSNLLIYLKIIFVMLYPVIPNKIEEFSNWIGWEYKLNFNSDFEFKIKDKEIKFVAFNVIKL